MQNTPDGMAWVPAGEFAMGSEAFYPEEGPVRPVAVEGFWIDRDPVTVADFRRFVKATGHVTVAERPLDPDDYPDADPELLVPGALVFQPSRGPVDLRDFRNWWDYVPGTTWQRPEGPASDTYTRGRHPVTQVAYEDASAYAAWAGKALPTEAEWEFAARGGLDGAVFAWGDEFAPDGQMMANTWQGEFPWQNLLTDGYAGTSPVGSFAAQRLRPARHDRQRLGVDVRPAQRRSHRAEPLLRPQRGGRTHPAARDQGRLAPVRAELLPALPPGRAPVRGGRHLDRPHRLPLRRAGRLTTRFTRSG